MPAHTEYSHVWQLRRYSTVVDFEVLKGIDLNMIEESERQNVPYEKSDNVP